MANCLRISGLAIGYIQLVLNSVMAIIIVVALCTTDYQTAQFAKGNGKELELSPEDIHFVSTVTFWVYIITLILSIVGEIIISLLVYGIHKNREEFMLPWLIMAGIGLGICALNFLWTVVYYISAGHPGFILSLLALLSIQFAIWRVVYHLYRQIKTNNQVNTANYKQFNNQYAGGQI